MSRPASPTYASQPTNRAGLAFLNSLDTVSLAYRKYAETYVRNEMKHGIADQRADGETKHQVDEVIVGDCVTESDDEETTQRDDRDHKHRRCPVAVHCNVQLSDLHVAHVRSSHFGCLDQCFSVNEIIGLLHNCAALPVSGTSTSKLSRSAPVDTDSQTTESDALLGADSRV